MSGVEVDIDAPAWLAFAPDAPAVVERAAQAALAVADRTGEAAILLTDDLRVQTLNRRFRGVDAPTNVLAFPAAAAPHEASLGDVALAFGVCEAEARAQGKPLEAHLAHLVAHGVLHLLGYDHGDDATAEEMETLERLAMDRLGWPDPYVLTLPVSGQAAGEEGPAP